MSAVADSAAWRAQMEASMRADDGWLTLAGLYWLNEGANTFGSGAEQDLVFPEGSCPAHLGTFYRDGDDVRVAFIEGEHAEINGAFIGKSGVLQGDGDGKYKPDVITYRDLSFYVVPRGHRVGIRLRDRNSDVRKAFTGRIWFDYAPEFVVHATFEAYEAGKTIPILNVLGDTDMMPSPGRVHFTIDGQACSMDAVDAGTSLFFNFRDKTSGKETYGAGRFLTVPGPVDGHVVIDFNKAVSPPCAFTIYATCPIAPVQNHLPVAINAGEKYHGEHH